MSRRDIQFAVALVGVVGLVIATVVSVLAVVFFEAPDPLAFSLVGSLTALTAAATAWLFRMNGGGQ